MPTAAWIDLAPGKGEPDWKPLAREYAPRTRRFIFHVASWQGYVGSQPLTWDHVPYSSNQDADDVRGVYAFVLDSEGEFPCTMPPHSVVLYVGETGNTGNATLKSRLNNYRNKKAQRSRARIYNMLEAWGDTLNFYYAPVNAGVSTLTCETELLDAFLPPENNKDFSAKVSNARNAVLNG